MTDTSERLRHLVESLTEEEGVTCEGGDRWAARSQEWYCAKLGVSSPTIRKLTAKPPFVRKRRHVDGKVTTLLRVGTPGPKTSRDYVNILGRIWVRKVGRRLSKKELGCLWALVEAWPSGRAPDLLSHTIDNWSAFMVGAHFQIEALGERGYKWYLRYPSLTVIRRFHPAAVELLMGDLQAADRDEEAEDLRDWVMLHEHQQLSDEPYVAPAERAA